MTMARPKDLNQTHPQQENIFVKFILLFPTVLIAIGDGVRTFFRFVLYILSTSYNVIKIIGKETTLGVLHWISEKKMLLGALRKRRQSSTKKASSASFHLPKIKLPHVS